jgi:serine/threonine protein kinase
MERKAIKIKKELFIQSSKTKNIRDDYEYIRELGSGGYGVVFLAQHRVTGIQPLIQVNAEQSKQCPRRMSLTKKCLRLRFSCSRNSITPTSSNSTRCIKLKRLFTW